MFYKNGENIDFSSDYKIIVCDKDETITPANQPIENSMAKRIVELMGKWCIVILTARNFEICQKHILENLEKNFSQSLLWREKNLIFACSNGSQIYQFDVKENIYKLLVQKEWQILPKEKFISLIPVLADKLGVPAEQILLDVRSPTMVTFACIPRDASQEERKKFDPTRQRRNSAIRAIRPFLPEGYEIISGGSTSIDIGLYDKKSGMEFVISQLEQHNFDFQKGNNFFQNISNSDVIFFGDNFDGGNDTPVEEVPDISIVKVKNPNDTAMVFDKILQS